MIQAVNISLQFGGRLIFDEVSFRINETDKIGLTGRNGAGKSTLLKVLMGIQPIEKGEITMPKGTTIGYLPQELNVKSDKTVLEETRTAFEQVMQLMARRDAIGKELEERTDYESDAYMDLITELTEAENQIHLHDGYQIEEQTERVLKGLGFIQEDFTKLVKELSGGWQMRIVLAKLLLQKPSLILLDEPTNHLDIESITWLEDFLKYYSGAVMMVSHDRLFLDNVTTRTIEVANGGIDDYKANYSGYLQQRKERREQQIAAQKNQEKEIDRLEKNIEKFRAKASKAKFAQSLIKRLDRMDRIEVESEDTASLRIRFPMGAKSGITVMKGKGIRKSYGENEVIRGLDFEIERGDKIAFVGKNGMGKTTLARIIARDMDKYEGKVDEGNNVELAYFAQHQNTGLNENLTVLQEMEQSAPPDMFTRVRGLLGAFLFSKDDVFKKVKVLSGGEKSRLAMAKLLMRPSNFLIMDEPTNHLDMRAKGVLKKALEVYEGTLIVVSHDRDFLHGLTNKTFEFTPEGIKEHLGDVYEFLEKKKVDNFRALELQKEKEQEAAKEEKAPSENKQRYEEKKQLEKEMKRLKNAIQKNERKIEELDKEIARLEAQLKDPAKYQDLTKDPGFFEKYEATKKEQQEVSRSWEEDVEAMARLEGQYEEVKG